MTSQTIHSRHLLRAVLSAICVGIAFAGVFVDPNVTPLTDATLDATLKNHTHSLVVFYAPWCGYCQQLSPKWSEVASELKDSPVLVAALDAEENQDAAEEYEIEGLPTIKLITSSGGDVPSLKARDFNGEPEAKSILRWVEKVTSATPAPEVKTSEDLERIREQKTSIIGVFDKLEGEAYDAFVEQTLDSQDDLAWYTTTDLDLAGVDSAPTLVFSRNFPGTPLEVVRRPFARATGRGEPDEEIFDFVEAHKHPDYYVYGPSETSRMMEELEFVEREHHIHVIVPPRLLEDKDFLKRAREAGRAVRDRAQLILSVFSDDSEIKGSFKMQKLDDEVQVFVAHTESIKKYGPESPIKPEAFDVDMLTDLMKSIEAGDDTFRTWASAPAPKEDTDKHGVKTAVRSTLEEIVGDEKKDVFVIAYVPEGDNDDAGEDDEGDFFLQIMRGLADALEGVPSDQIVRFDAYANEHALFQFPFEEMPMFTLFPATDGKEKTPVHLEDAQAGFSIKALAEFVHRHAGVKFELPADLPDDMGDEDLGEEISLADLGLDVDGVFGGEDGEDAVDAHEEL